MPKITGIHTPKINKNYITNGAFDFYQRGLSFTNPANGTYVADRFRLDKTGSMTYNTTQDTGTTPPLSSSNRFAFPSTLGIIMTGAQPSLAAGDLMQLVHKIEGKNFAPLTGKTLTFSFWVRVPPGTGGTYAVSFRNETLNRSYVSTFTVDNSGLFNRKSITFTHDNSGTWNYLLGSGLTITFGLAGGTSVQTPTLNSWVSGNYITHSSCNNFASSTSNSMSITGIQLEEGDTTSDFNRAGETIAEELLLCQRYYEKSYVLGTAPGTPSIGDGAVTTLSTGTAIDITVFFIANKRTAPSVITRSTVTGTTGQARDESSAVDRPTLTSGVSEKIFRVVNNGAYVTGNRIAFQWEADAEI